MADQYSTSDGSVDLNTSDSKKRPHDGAGEGRPSYKRSNLGAAKTPIVKILIPNHAAGSIIGKGGANIAEVQQTTGARIKLSPNNDYYPGTQERVGLIMGEVETINKMLNFVIEKIRQEPPAMRLNPAMTYDRERSKQMKIVVPNSTAGLIIGKSGVTIKYIGDQTGARIQVSQKNAETVPGERVIGITGSLEQVQAACAVIAAKVQEDPEHALNNNISYSSLSIGSHHRLSNGSSGVNAYGGGGLSGSGLGGLGFHNAGGTGNSAAANNILAHAALLSGGGLGANNPLLNAMGNLGPLGLTSSSSHIHSTATLELTVPDDLIGAVLGKQGKTINEFMQYSGAKIQVSQKGEFIPGTNNRKVVITGDLNCAQTAHFLITQRLQQVEAERLLGQHS
ncbi:RNA-binding protein Nova-1 [Desmophyllum pertusum]|uniref:RNA-binding protein Nova-1 n=1 Tax=Desmophyllum pertusum TaxID=174260 RepID=A0A9W9YBR0_9CNID|nr:RNA-binding protein Nova-1 [Desmophyllum pertusum]